MWIPRRFIRRSSEPGQIGQRDVHDAIQPFEDLHTFPAAGVVDQRKSQAARGCIVDRQHDVWRVVCGSDEVDVHAAHALQLEHHVSHVPDAAWAALAALADFPTQFTTQANLKNGSA